MARTPRFSRGDVIVAFNINPQEPNTQIGSFNIVIQKVKQDLICIFGNNQIWD